MIGHTACTTQGPRWKNRSQRRQTRDAFLAAGRYVGWTPAPPRGLWRGHSAFCIGKVSATAPRPTRSLITVFFATPVLNRGVNRIALDQASDHLCAAEWYPSVHTIYYACSCKKKSIFSFTEGPSFGLSLEHSVAFQMERGGLLVGALECQYPCATDSSLGTRRTHLDHLEIARGCSCAIVVLGFTGWSHSILTRHLLHQITKLIVVTRSEILRPVG